MSAELFKLYFGANKLVYPVRMCFSAYHSRCIKPVSYIVGALSFKATYGCTLPLQRMSSKMFGPFRNCCVSCTHVPYSYRTYSSQKLGHNYSISYERKGLSENHYFPSVNVVKGYKTCHALQQASKEKKDGDIPCTSPEPEEKLSLFKRYRKMLKEYWYVLLPVHVATSLIWFGSFYYMATCGLDIVPFLEKLGVGETIISPLKNSSLGYIAVASALYKIATPARYMVTLGGTTVAINYLKKYGLVKPVPSKAKIKSMIQNKFKQQEKKTKESS